MPRLLLLLSHLGIGSHGDHSTKLFGSHKRCCNGQWLLTSCYLSAAFLENKKILNLCHRWHILRSYWFVAVITFNRKTKDWKNAVNSQTRKAQLQSGQTSKTNFLQNSYHLKAVKYFWLGSKYASDLSKRFAKFNVKHAWWNLFIVNNFYEPSSSVIF